MSHCDCFTSHESTARAEFGSHAFAAIGKSLDIRNMCSPSSHATLSENRCAGTSIGKRRTKHVSDKTYSKYAGKLGYARMLVPKVRPGGPSSDDLCYVSLLRPTAPCLTEEYPDQSTAVLRNQDI